MSDTDTRPAGGLWLLLAVPVLLIGAVVVSGHSGTRDKRSDCLPDMPAARPGSGRVVWPMPPDHRTVSSPFGLRDGRPHNGIDFAAPERTPILAATDGTVAAAGPAEGFGQWIVLDTTIDGHPYSTVYGHMWTTSLRVGQTVTAGQPIAEVGANGESDGPHLHFEVWSGGKLSGGTAVNPLPWLTGHAGPASGTPAPPNLAATAAAAVGTSLPALPASIGSEDHLQTDTVRLVRAVHAEFPAVASIGGWRAADPYPDHPSGRAADIMIPHWDSPEGKALGDSINDYVHDHAEDFGVVYTIFRQTYRPAHGTPNQMEDRGSPTENHFDHVHVTVEGHGPPPPGQTYTAPGAGTGHESGCVPAHSDTPLRPGTVPAPFAPWIERASRTCPEVTAPILAAQLDQESGFRVDAYNDNSHAAGPAQFIPTTWQTEGIDGDGDGAIDPRSIPDAVMSQGSYDCKLAAFAKEGVAQGKLHGDLTELWLSAYNCGPSNTLSQTGVCQNPETLGYVRDIPRRAAQFADPGPNTALAGALR
ncbi:M23 family metallopeptidase [Nocardia blacklockiae]|uniref:M23 family metallopeptidase n=1 Tax=Nocardia blacklockiae TaxID=480036 RepID=UPI001892E26E|nr:M23 family metallopeptidase [Nocardia blacklockiae]MBF6171136.1 M23 family metallopeptidase [Nocardia blacklockiae]